MNTLISRYALRPTRPFRVDIGINYVVDLPESERWSNTATIKSDYKLKEGDLIRLPSGSWLEVAETGSCWGTDSLVWGLLERLESSCEIEREIPDKRKEGRIYKTLATYIR